MSAVDADLWYNAQHVEMQVKKEESMNCLVAVSAIRCVVGCNVGSPDAQALHVMECDVETGAARIVQSVRGVQGTTYFQLDAARRYLYSAIGEEKGGRRVGSLVRFKVENGGIGDMERLAELPCETPCHVSLTPDGRRVAFAAYTSATAGTCPVEGGPVASFVLPDDDMGPNPTRQKKAYAHFTFYTPDGRRLGVIDLGCDRIWFFDPATMERDVSMTVKADPGDGPRHAVWSKDARFLFVVNELGSSVSSFAWDGKSFRKVGKWSMLPPGYTGDSKAAAIKLTDDGRLLMASNRGCDSIAFFDVDTSLGTLLPRNIAKLTGSFPRDFELMPGERFMVVGHKMSNEIQVYAFDRGTCSLSPVGRPVEAWRPLCFKFL